MILFVSFVVNGSKFRVDSTPPPANELGRCGQFTVMDLRDVQNALHSTDKLVAVHYEGRVLEFERKEKP